MNLIFFGTSKFAVPILAALIKKALTPIAIITAEDKPIGRNKTFTPGPIKLMALDHRLKLFQPLTLKDQQFLETFKKLKPELCVIAAYGKIIPKDYLEVPKFGFLNVHPSLLPKYRGPTPIQTAILNGESQTGVTIMLVDEEIDHGPIITSAKLEVGSKNYEKLKRELSELGAELLLKIIPDWISGKLKTTPQDHSQATFTKKFSWEDGKIDWSKKAEELEKQIRALNPEPGVWTKWNPSTSSGQGKTLKILEADTIKFQKSESTIEPGRVSLIDKEIIAACGDGGLILKKVQLEGKKVMEIHDFINGHRDFVGSVLN